jgi:hypothetical protein
MKPPRWSDSEASLLISLRTQFSDHTWEELAILFNSYLPVERQRSSDAIKKKWKKSNQYMYLTFPPIERNVRLSSLPKFRLC